VASVPFDPGALTRHPSCGPAFTKR